MIRTKTALAVAACLAGAVSGSIGAAQAASSSTGATGTTAPTSTPATITVNGSDTFTVDSSAPAATVAASYLGALGGALTNAHTKAASLAGAAGDTLGPVENITEQSSYNGGFCTGPLFMGASGVAKGAPASTGSSPAGKKPHHASKPKKATAQIAAVIAPTSCTIAADVTVTYTMAPA